MRRKKTLKKRIKKVLKKIAYNDYVHKFTSWLLYAYVKFVIITSKKEYVTDHKKYLNTIQTEKPIIQVTWHGRMLAGILAIPTNLRKGYSVLASKHKDGQYAGEMMEFFGLGNIKGSSGNPQKGGGNTGGAGAIRKMASELKKGRGIWLTPDGPRGPKHILPSNVLGVAKVAGTAILVPMMYTSSKALKLKTWDEFLVPLPFGKIYIYTGNPVKINKTTTKEELDKIAVKLEKELNSKMMELDKLANKK